jgi:hypothetical protein
MPRSVTSSKHTPHVCFCGEAGRSCSIVTGSSLAVGLVVATSIAVLPSGNNLKGSFRGTCALGGTKTDLREQQSGKEKEFFVAGGRFGVRAVPPSPKKKPPTKAFNPFNGRCNPPQQGLPKHVLIQYLHNIYTSFPSSSARKGVT